MFTFAGMRAMTIDSTAAVALVLAPLSENVTHVITVTPSTGRATDTATDGFSYECAVRTTLCEYEVTVCVATDDSDCGRMEASVCGKRMGEMWFTSPATSDCGDAMLSKITAVESDFEVTAATMEVYEVPGEGPCKTEGDIGSQ